jgi:hypothetical protein
MAIQTISSHVVVRGIDHECLQVPDPLLIRRHGVSSARSLCNRTP